MRNKKRVRVKMALALGVFREFAVVQTFADGKEDVRYKMLCHQEVSPCSILAVWHLWHVAST